MKLVLLLRVDEVPWRQVPPDRWPVADFVRLIDEARVHGLVFSVLPSARTLIAFPSLTDLVLGEGHRLVTQVTGEVRVEDVAPGTDADRLAEWVKRQRAEGWTL